MSDFKLCVAAKVPDGDSEDVPEYMLSIEEWRAKVEQDEINRMAREAKEKLLSQLEVIRNKVNALIEANKTKERNQQLAPEEFVIDPLLKGLGRALRCPIVVFNYNCCCNPSCSELYEFVCPQHARGGNYSRGGSSPQGASVGF